MFSEDTVHDDGDGDGDGDGDVNDSEDYPFFCDDLILRGIHCLHFL